MGLKSKSEKTQPPRWAVNWLKWFCREEDLEILLGDVYEMFEKRVQIQGATLARWRFVLDVFSLFRPFAWKKIYPFSSKFVMYRHYFIASIRNLKKSLNYSLIHVLGLTLGILCSTILFLKIRHELRFDHYHSDADRIFRIVTVTENPNKTEYDAGVCYPFREAFALDFPELEEVTLIDGNVSGIIRVPDKNGKEHIYEEESLIAVSPDYFDLFHYEWLAGSPQVALQQPYELVITDELALKYFGTTDVIGKQMSLKAGQYWEIIGVVRRPPAYTDFPFQLFKTQTMDDPKEWGMYQWSSSSSSVQCYFKLPRHIKPSQVEKQLPDFIEKHYRADDAAKMTMSLQPLSKIHFDQQFGLLYSKPAIARSSLWAIGLIGLVILLSACINFINLNNALIFRRAKEIGIRKVLGSIRRQIVRYFLVETGLLIFIALMITVALTGMLIPRLSFLLDAELDLNMMTDFQLIGFWGLLFVLIMLLAGLYPAIRLSLLPPTLALKNQFRQKWKDRISLRQGLLVTQFLIAQVLIICTLIAHRQMQFFQQAPLGFDKEAVIQLRMPSEYEIEELIAWRAKMNENPAVRGVAFSNTGAASNNTWGSVYSYYPEDTLKPVIEGKLQVKAVDEHYLDVYGIRLMAGKNLRYSESIDQIIVNEAFARQVVEDDPEQVVGRTMSVWGQKAPIIGMVKDFTTKSLKEKIEPVALISQTAANSVGVKVEGQNLQAVIPQLKSDFEAVFPGQLFDYHFLDETIAEFYESEKRATQIFQLAALLAIFIGCMGLFGMISFLTERRTKEIGIRKVLGAPVAHIWYLFTKDFGLQLLIGFLLAMPLAWYVMREWLSDFAYHISIEADTFVWAFLISSVIMLLTVSYKILRAARANPIYALRNE